MYEYYHISLHMHRYACIFTDFHASAYMCMNRYGYVWICITMQESIWICMDGMDMSKYARICMVMHGYVWICMDMFGHTMMFRKSSFSRSIALLMFLEALNFAAYITLCPYWCSLRDTAKIKDVWKIVLL